MEGIVKSVEPKSDGIPSVKTQNYGTTQLPVLSFKSIPLDVYHFFGLELGKSGERETGKLMDISEWAFQEAETIGDALKKLDQLERSLGYPRIDEKRHDKIWNWIRIQNNIEDLKKRQEALGGKRTYDWTTR